VENVNSHSSNSLNPLDRDGLQLLCRL
jgi:hypothetical protein